MEQNFDTSYYSTIAASFASEFWEPPYNTTQDLIETPIEHTLAFWETNSPINIFPNTPESLSFNESDLSCLSSETEIPSNEPITNIIDIPAIDNITFEQLEHLIFKGPETTLPCIDENELKDVLEFIEKDLSQPMKMDLSKSMEKQYKCIACQKTFTSRPGIRKHFNTKRHKEVVAASGKPDPATMQETWTKGTYDCFVCAKSFSKYTNMIDHVVTH